MFYEQEAEQAGGLDEEVAQLGRAWRTEVHCPELLPFQRELVMSLTQRLQDQQAIIDERVRTPQEIFTASLYQMDIDRVRYALSRYLRARILKIEDSVDYIMSKMDVLDRLSSQEKTFATKLYNLNNSYMEEAYFNRLPQHGLKEHIEQENDRLMHSQPALNGHVFCMANTELSNVHLGVEQHEFQKNNTFVACYDEVREHVFNSDIDLI